MVSLAPPPPASGIRAHGLSPGTAAPELDIPATSAGNRIVLAEQRGSPIVLVFYPGDFTLLSDFHPKGEVCRRFDVYRDDIGTAERALFVLDGHGRIFWSHVSPIEINPGADGVLAALEQLTGKELEAAVAAPPADAEPQPRSQPHEEETRP